MSRLRQDAGQASSVDKLGTPLLKNWWWLAKIEISRLRFHLRRSGYGGQVATLEMTTPYIYPVLAHEPISAAPIKAFGMTMHYVLTFRDLPCHFERSPADTRKEYVRDGVDAMRVGGHLHMASLRILS